MKNIFYFALLMLVWGCEKNEVSVYDQVKSSIQFDYPTGEMKLDYDFAFRYIDKITPGSSSREYYLGDSIQRDTVKIKLSVLGLKAGEDREISLKTVPVKGQDSTMLAKVEFLPPYYLKAGKLNETIKVILLRPSQRGKYTIGLAFDIDEDSIFEQGVEEQSTFSVDIIDRYPKPDSWGRAAYFLGEYSEEKYAFYVTVLHKRLEEWASWDKSALKTALKKHNTEHPNAPKDFTFPD